MLIVALDVFSFDEMKSIVETTKGEVEIYKIGMQLLTAEGPQTIRYLKDLGKTVFLDLKLHEISNSVASAVKAAGMHGVDMVTVHSSGGRRMMTAAVRAASEFQGMEVLALTVVTELNDQDLLDVGFNRSSMDQVVRLAKLAEECGCHGVIASPQEARSLRAELNENMLIVTPGIKLDYEEEHDREGSPSHAISCGASHIVVGRSMIQAENPRELASEINNQIQLAAGA